MPKKPLKELLKEMDEYNWDEIPDFWNDPPTYADPQTYEKNIPEIFRRCLQNARVSLSGSVLDLACGPVSLGCIYKDVVGFDIKPSYIKRLRQKGTRGVIGDIRDLPFEDNSFDFVIGVAIPWRILFEAEGGIHKFIDQCIQIARKKVILFGIPANIEDYFPPQYYKKIKKDELYLICDV